MNGTVHRVRLVALLVVACASGAELAAQDSTPRVDGAQFECAELEQMVRSARRLSITAVHVNPHSDDRESTNTFVAGPAFIILVLQIIRRLTHMKISPGSIQPTRRWLWTPLTSKKRLTITTTNTGRITGRGLTRNTLTRSCNIPCRRVHCG